MRKIPIIDGTTNDLTKYDHIIHMKFVGTTKDDDFCLKFNSRNNNHWFIGKNTILNEDDWVLCQNNCYLIYTFKVASGIFTHNKFASKLDNRRWYVIIANTNQNFYDFNAMEEYI